METIYIVVDDEGDSRAVFRDRKNAELYVSCNKDCLIIESHFNDDDICTPFNYVFILCEMYLYNTKNNVSMDIHFDFEKGCTKDEEKVRKKLSDILIYNEKYIEIILNRRLPEVYDERDIRGDYKILLEDLKEEITSLFLKQNISDESDYTEKKKAEQNILKAIEDKLYVEVE